MRRCLALTLSLITIAAVSPALAQTQPPPFRPGSNVSDTNPEPAKIVCWSGSVWTPCSRVPVSNGPNGDPAAGLDSASAYQSSGGTIISQPNVFYSISVTLAAGQGPGRLMIWDSITLPPDGALVGTARPTRCVYVDAGDRTTTFASASGMGMDIGLSWAFSSGSSCTTKTSATADFVAVSYRR